MKFCVKCGEQLKEKSNFCTACGARVEPVTPIEANSEVENEIKEQSSTDVKVQNEDMGKRTTKNDPVVVGPTTQTAQMIKNR